MVASLAVWRAAANSLWHLRMRHKVCQCQEEQLVNSWRMDIFMQGLPRERGAERVERTVYKEAIINKVFVSFLDLNFRVHCFGFEKEPKGP